VYGSVEGVRYSATDLLTWLGCAHASRLDARAMSEPALRRWLRDRRDLLEADLDSGVAFPEPAARRGEEHERATLDRLKARGLTVAHITRPGPEGLAGAVTATVAAMRAGADVVFQAALTDGPWFGYADFLVRVDGWPSRFGGFAYEVRDTKLARHATASALLQTAHYGAMVELVQGAPPPRLVLLLGDGREFAWAYEDAAPYLAEVRERFLAFHTAGTEPVAEPVRACGLCRWADRCEQAWGPQDLRHVHRLTGPQRRALHQTGIGTVAGLAAAGPAARPDGMHEKTFDRLRAQAAVQTGTAGYELVRPQDSQVGIWSTPARHPLDMYLDLEGDPFAAVPTLDYLWAYCDVDGTYVYRWAHTPEGERRAVLWLLGELRRREALGGDWHVYHYNTYEPAAIGRVLGSWPDDTERAALQAEMAGLVQRRFDDLYRRVEAGVRTRDGSTSLKVVEKIAGYDRTAAAAAVGGADDSIKAYEQYLRTTDDEPRRAELLEGIRRYNEHDVRATKRVHDWLLRRADDLGERDLTDADDDTGHVPSDRVRERVEATADLQRRLTDAGGPAGGPLPSGLSTGGALMLAAMLEWHRNEMLVAFADHRRLHAWALDGDPHGPLDDHHVGQPTGPDGPAPNLRRTGTEGESCLLDVTGPTSTVAVPGGGSTSRKVRRTYACRPGAWRVRAGTALQEALPDGAARKPVTVTVTGHDPVAGTFSFERVAVPDDLGPLVVGPFAEPPAVWEALMRLGEAALTPDPAPDQVLPLRVLDRLPAFPPTEMAPRPGEDATGRGLRLAGALRAGLLPVQGPPGTGKTRLAARIVLRELDEAARQGRTAVVGVVAGSHKVIGNLLAEVRRLADQTRTAVDVAHLGDPTQVDTDHGITRLAGSSAALAPWTARQREAGRPGVVGATKFGWSRSDTAGTADLLVVDEAGQVSLADALAVMQASARVVALGDPQQLAAPVQATQTDAVRVSLLEHLTGGKQVMPPEVGVFLDVTHRMHPAVCAVVGELSNRGALTASPAAARRGITGPALTLAGHTVPVTPGVVWLPVEGGPDTEAATVAELVRRLTLTATVTTEDGTGPLTPQDVLVVAPHNAHVNRIARAVGAGVRVGTVDRFQGQQGHVVILAMGREARTAQDVRFLYETNRLNVALSRARLLVVVVAHPDACYPPVNDPEDLLLASRFNRALKPRRAAPVTDRTPS